MVNESVNDVMNFSDEELFEKLQEHGFNVGPIVDSTRLVYQKKLIQILEGGYVASPDYSNSEDGDDGNGDTSRLSDTESSMRQRPTPQSNLSHLSSTPPRSYEHSGSPYGLDTESSMRQRPAPQSNLSHLSSTPPRSYEHSGSPYGVTSRPSLSSVSGRETAYTPVSKPTPLSPPHQGAKENLMASSSMSKLIAVFVVVIVLIILLYYNFESSSSDNPVPKI